MRLLDRFSRARAVGLLGVLVAAVAVAGYCVGVSSAAAGVIKTIHVGLEPEGVSSDGTHVWVANEELGAEGTVSEIEASSGTVIRTIKVGLFPKGVSSDGAHVWVANQGYAPQGTVSEIEASSGTVIRTIPVGSEPEGVSSDGTRVWVANASEGTVSEIEASSGIVIRTIKVGSLPRGVSSDGTHVWVANWGESTVSEIEASSGIVIRTIAAGGEPWGVFSNGTRVWVADWGEGKVSEIEASSGTVIRTIPVGSSPRGVSYDGTRVWVTNQSTSTVSEIEASSGTVIRTIPVASNLRGVSSDGTHVWVASEQDNTISEITTGPEAAIEAPAAGGTYVKGAVVTTQFSCTEGEGGPGLESCTDSNGGSGTSGVLETATLGPHTYTVTAEGKDGKTGTASINYAVATTTCTSDTGTVKLSPGLTNTATVQTMTIKGTLTGCADEPFTKVKYTATLKTAGPVACSALITGEPATGTTTYKWTPKAETSTGTLSMPLTETSDIAFSGEVTTGSYSPLTLTGIVTESYTGGARCGEKIGLKHLKAVNKGTFSGSAGFE